MFLFFTFYLYLICAISIMLLLGWFCFKIAGTGNDKSISYFTLFKWNFSGYIIVTLCYSIYKSDFITINLILLIPITLLFIENKIKTNSILKLQEKDIISSKTKFSKIPLSLVIISLCIYILCFILIVSTNQFGYTIPHTDSVIYSKISNYLAKTGNENNFNVLNSLNPVYNSPKPYHYFDLWFNALFTTIFGGKYLVNYVLITFSVQFTLVYLLLLSLFEQFLKINYLIFIISFLLLFVGEISMNSAYYGCIFNFNLQKHLIYYIIILLFFILMLQNKNIYAFLILSTLPLFTAITAPCIYGGTILYCLFSLNNKKEEKSIHLRILVYTFFIAVLFFCFYYLFDKIKIVKDTSAVGPTISGTLLVLVTNILHGDWMLVKDWLYISWYIGLNFLKSFFLQFIFILIYLYYFFDENNFTTKFKKILLIGVALFIPGFITYLLLYKYIDSDQIYYNFISTFLISILIFICIRFFVLFQNRENSHFSTGKKIFYFCFILCFGSVLLLNIYYFINFVKQNRTKTEYSDNYLCKIRTVIDTMKLNPIGCNLRGKIDFTKSVHYRLITVFTDGDYLGLIKNDFATVTLSDFVADVDYSEYPQKDFYLVPGAIEMGCFYQFVNNQKSENKFHSIEKSQIDFISNHHINYIIASRNAELTPPLQKMINFEIIDSLSGERFIILNENIINI